LARWFSEGAPVLKVVEEESESNAHAPAAVGGSLLDEIVRDGARQMLAAALQAEVAVYVEDHAAQFDENGRRLVVRTGHHQPREVATAAGVVAVRAPRVNDKRTDVEAVARRRERVQHAFAGRDRLRVLLGRRDPPQGPSGPGQCLSAGDDRSPRGWHQGADRSGRWVP